MQLTLFGVCPPREGWFQTSMTLVSCVGEFIVIVIGPRMKKTITYVYEGCKRQFVRQVWFHGLILFVTCGTAWDNLREFIELPASCSPACVEARGEPGRHWQDGERTASCI